MRQKLSTLLWAACASALLAGAAQADDSAFIDPPKGDGAVVQQSGDGGTVKVDQEQGRGGNVASVVQGGQNSSVEVLQDGQNNRAFIATTGDEVNSDVSGWRERDTLTEVSLGGTTVRELKEPSGKVEQTGRGNTALLGSAGDGDAFGIDQDGARNLATVTQGGWFGIAGGNRAIQRQNGDDNRAVANQFGQHNYVEQIQKGDGNSSIVTQIGIENTLVNIQDARKTQGGLSFSITQSGGMKMLVRQPKTATAGGR
jgi:hypothetical protein